MANEAKYEDRRKDAVARYELQVAFLEKGKRDARRLYYTLQSTVIVATGITPVLIVAGADQWIQVAFPAAAGIAASVSALFQYHRSWLRRALTVEALKSEFHLFSTRAGKVYQTSTPDDEALNRFIKRTEQIYKDERDDWIRSRPSDDADA
jgi:Protein of unknown function (DUF4231)